MRLSNFLAFTWICLLSVNSHGVIGGVDDTPEECSVCLKGSCRSVNGIYTRPDLPQGYSLVAQIPKGACRILIQQLKHTRNFLALKNSNGSFIVNGDWKFSNSRVVDGAGTKFTYIKQDGNTLETISSTGPILNPIDIMIVHYQANAGIKYGYSLPMSDDQPHIAPPLLRKPQPEESSHNIETRRLDLPSSINSTFAQKDEAIRPHHHRRTRFRRKYFQWKVTGLTACSRSCGGGIQTYVKQCVREIPQQTAIPVNEKRCAHVEQPVLKPVRCNTDNCPPDWDGYWTDCSASCGDGVQQYKYKCKQDLTTGGSVIADEQQCIKPKPPHLSRTCRLALCDNISDNELVPATTMSDVRIADWTVGPWTTCSVSCGTGYKTRPVSCPSGQCSQENRPKHAEYCESQPCLKSATTTVSKTSNWLLTEWSQCSEACGTGTQTRLSVCLRNDCDPTGKPETSRACSSDKQCNGQWFTGPWGACSDSCSGPAKQRREVLCIGKIRGQSHITNEMTCPAHLKPIEEQSCAGSCPPHWFIGDWSACEGPCNPNGVQHREVKCLEVDGKPSNGCSNEDVPLTRRTCACVNRREEKYIPAQDEPNNDRSCIDRNYKCKLVVQARLCKYVYYKNFCCESCRRAPQDDVLE